MAAERSELSAWVGEELKALRVRAGLDVNTVAKAAKMSPAGIRKMETANGNPTVESIDLYVKACGKTIGEFFAPKIPPGRPGYDRYVHGVIKSALEHPKTMDGVRHLVGLLSEAMK